MRTEFDGRADDVTTISKKRKRTHHNTLPSTTSLSSFHGIFGKKLQHGAEYSTILMILFSRLSGGLLPPTK